MTTIAFLIIVNATILALLCAAAEQSHCHGARRFLENSETDWR